MSKQKLEEERKNQLILLIRDFCQQKLDEEYFELSVKLIKALEGRREAPLNGGKIEIWAAAIIHALGTINFLFDKSFIPYVTIDEINDFFKTSKSSTGNKSRVIRELLHLTHFDADFSTTEIQQNNPFNRMRMVDGFIVMDPDYISTPEENEKQTVRPEQKINKPQKKSNATPFDMDMFEGMVI